MEDNSPVDGGFAEALEGLSLSRAERRDQQTQRILDAATACFVRSGFQGASMQQICAEAGMSPGALYRYFSSKEAIIEAISEADRRQDAELFKVILSNPDVVEGVVTGAIAHIRHVHESNTAALFAEICAESMRNPSVESFCNKNMEQVMHMLAAYLGAAKARGEIDPPVELEVLLPALMAIAHGMALNDLPAQGVPFDKLEVAASRLGRRHASTDQSPARQGLIAKPKFLSFVSKVMSTSKNSLIQSLAALLVATTMLGGMPIRLPRRRAKRCRSSIQAPPAIRVVAAEKRELVETLSVNGTIVAREEAATGTDLNGLTVIAAQRRHRRRGEEGRRACRSRPLDARHPACADAGDPRPGRGQHRADARPDRRRRDRRPPGRRGAGARPRPAEEGRRHQDATRQCRERRRQRARQARLGRKRRSPPPRRSSASSTRRPTTCWCRSPRPSCARRPTAWCLPATRRSAAWSWPAADRCSGSPSARNSSLPPTSPKRRLPRLARGMPAKVVAGRRRTRHRRLDPQDFSRSQPGLAARRDPHRA